MPTSLRVPVLLERAAGEQLQIFGAQEFALTSAVRDTYREPMTRYRERLQGYFLGNYYDNVRRPKARADGTFDPNDGPEPIWDIVRAKQLRSEDVLAGEFDDLIDETGTEVGDLFDEELTDGYEESYDLGLWMLYLGGIDSTTAAPPPERSGIKRALLLAGLAGIGYPTRLGAWGADTKGRYRQRLRGLIASGATVGETLDAYDMLAETHVGRVEGLGQNELYRAYGVGQTAAVSQFTKQVDGEVWLTRGDAVVCPICRAKNMTITVEQPITHSHPGCRCRKVPIPLNYAGQPIDYVAFLQKLGKR